MTTTNLTLTGSYSLNPFKKKTNNLLTTPTTNTTQTTTKLNSSDLNKANNPYGYTTGNNANNYDLSPTTLIASANKTNKTTTPVTTTPYKTVADTLNTTNTKTSTSNTPTALDNYMASLQGLSDKQSKLENQNYLDTADFETNQANDQNAALLQGLSGIKSSLDQYTNTTNENLAKQKFTTETNYGKQQKQLAQTRNESEARNRNRFAALNTGDSAGAGSFDEAQSNTESDFNSSTQELLTAKQNQIDTLENNAYNAIQDQLSKYQEQVISVNSAVNTNNATKAKNIATAKYNAQTNINNILANLDNLKYQQLSTGDGQLSENFLKTGTPTTAAEYKFLQSNKDAFATVGSSSNGNNGKALQMVNNLLGENLGAISGAVRTGSIPVIGQLNGGATAKTDYEGLQSLLSLAKRGELKGSGAVSDFESKMLEKAALAGLDTRLPTAEFKKRLQSLQQDLMGGDTSTGNTLQIGNYKVSY